MTHRCQGKTQDGTRCQRHLADKRSRYCYQHNAAAAGKVYRRRRRRSAHRGGADVDVGAVVEGVQAMLPVAMDAMRSAGQGMRRGWESVKRRFSRGRELPPPPSQEEYPQYPPSEYGYPQQQYYGGRRSRRRRRSSRRR